MLLYEAFSAKGLSLKKIVKGFIDVTIGYLEKSKPLVIVLILAVVIMGGLNGYKYLQFAKSNPQFCQLCHLMKEPLRSWQLSSHRNIVCQTCHSMSLIAQNSLLLSYVFSGNNKESSRKHGKLAPWESCRSCHLDEAEQGAITMRKSYGHARHVFMEKIECNRCHTGDTHNFIPHEGLCMKCHEDKGVHGMGMESFACLSCHVYSETPAMPKKQKCVMCHKNIPPRAPMGTVDCQNCHKPHGKLHPTAIDCLSNCHVNQAAIGRHDRHIDIPCLECHKAHTWKVGKQLAVALCSKCHEYKDPLSFIF